MRYLVVILLLSSCVTEKKAHRWMDAHPLEASTYCVAAFPIRELRDTVYLEDDTSPYDSAFNELWNYIDYLRDYNGSKDSIFVFDSIRTVFKTKYLPYTRTKYVTITRTDSANVVKYQESINELNKQLEVTQKVANAKITKILGIAITAILTMGYQIRRLIRKTKK